LIYKTIFKTLFERNEEFYKTFYTSSTHSLFYNLKYIKYKNLFVYIDNKLQSVFNTSRLSTEGEKAEKIWQPPSFIILWNLKFLTALRCFSILDCKSRFKAKILWRLLMVRWRSYLSLSFDVSAFWTVKVDLRQKYNAGQVSLCIPVFTIVSELTD
jgi:hypothetical protein